MWQNKQKGENDLLRVSAFLTKSIVGEIAVLQPGEGIYDRIKMSISTLGIWPIALFTEWLAMHHLLFHSIIFISLQSHTFLQGFKENIKLFCMFFKYFKNFFFYMLWHEGLHFD
jgi:hypothetical protein